MFLHLEYQLDYVEVEGVRYPIYDFRKARSWCHLDLWQYQTYLTARIPRYKDNFGKCKSVSVPWTDTCSRLSIFLEKTLITLESTKSQSKTAFLMGLSFDQVHLLMRKSVSRSLSSRISSEFYEHLSIDEKCVGRGHKYVSILSDATTGKVIDLVAGRDSQSATKLCNSLTFEQRRRVSTVCADMWPPYISAVANYFPAAKHCFDNFHLVGYLSKAVDKVRRSEVKKFYELKNSKYLFLKDKSNFTDTQRLKFDSILRSNYRASIAWRVKENFRSIQFKQDRVAAIQMYELWHKDALSVDIKEITDVVSTFDKFHIVQHLSKAMDTVRRDERKGNDLLKNHKYTYLRLNRNLTD